MVKYTADLVPDQKIHAAVHLGLTAVDEYRCIAPEILQKAGCRIYIQGGAAHDQQIRLLQCSNALRDHITVQGFLVQHHVRLDHSAAGAFRHALCIFHVGEIVGFAAFHTVTEVAAYLKEHPGYRNVLADMDENRLHRGEIEKLLVQSLYSDYTRLYRFSGMDQKKFLELYLKRYEMNLINYCLRIVFNHYQKPFDLDHKKIFFDKYSDLSIDKLITSGNIGELVENLKGTEYYAPLKRLENAENPTLFDYDLALNLYYFTTMWKKRKKILKHKELEIFTRDAGAKIDLLNLQWIYRAKKYYNMLPPDISTLLIPIHYRIHVDQLKDLVEAPSVDEFLKLVTRTPYLRHTDTQTPASIETIYKDCLYRLYLADRRSNPYSIATVNTYLFLKEEELDKLTTVLECVRYGLPARETLTYIGGTAK